MKKIVLTALLALTIAAPAIATPALAAPKTYQVTGPVTALTADTITVQKGKESWELARGTATVPDSVKVGSKVTIMYSMTATTVTAKDTVMAKAAKATTPATTAATPAPAPAATH
jgi:hypothetical protein